jgi:hypothetical protein
MPSRKIHRTLLAAALGLWSGAVARAQTPVVPDTLALTRQSQLVFEGTVVRVGEPNITAVRPAADLAVVRIDTILDGPHRLEEFTGHEVTVKLAGPAQAGERAVFFTRTWLYSESLGLVEAGRTAAGSAVRAQVAAARRRIADEEMQHRVGEAALVVAGRVVETRAAQGVEQRRGEHAPVWREAVIEVDQVLKGSLEGRRAVVLYPTTSDLAWRNVPKLDAGWDGVWLLAPSPDRAGTYIVPTAWNLMPRESLATVQRMVTP